MFHQEEIKPVRPAKIINGDDARMVQFRQGFGFARKAFGKSAVLPNAGRQNLQGRHAVKFLLSRLINRAHATPPDQLDDVQLRKQPRQILRSRR